MSSSLRSEVPLARRLVSSFGCHTRSSSRIFEDAGRYSLPRDEFGATLRLSFFQHLFVIREADIYPMKRLRLDRWGGQLLQPRRRPCCLRQHTIQSSQPALFSQCIRKQSTVAESDLIYEDAEEPAELPTPSGSENYASPSPEAALRSAKLAALHARLSLPKKLPLQTMARTLVDPSADNDTRFNNASLAQLGGSILSYHVSEYLLCRYPRLPMAVLFAAANAYSGPKTLQLIGREWGVETAAAPGVEVDPGYLQFEKLKPGAVWAAGQGGAVRPDKYATYRRGMSSRVVYDDEFGDTIPKDNVTDAPLPTENAYANFVKAVVGAISLHAGRQAAKSFVTAHVLSRHLDIASLFAFKEPVRELARLCQREDFEHPVARMLSETGRHSRTPVFVVGIFSGQDKLGEGAASSLSEARVRASVAALKAWYLYSPGQDVRLPSETEGETSRPWEPVHIDIGEIIH